MADTGDRDIVICDQQGTDSEHREIMVCSEQDSTDDGREIVVCNEQDVDCSDPPELDIEGPGAPVVGSVYTPSGGVEPYSFSMSGGTIDDDGEVLSVTSCGGSGGNGAVGSVTVTDACGQSASLTVRLPGGSWVFHYELQEVYAQTNCCFDPNDSSYENGRNNSQTYICIIGEYRITERRDYCCDAPLVNTCESAVCSNAQDGSVIKQRDYEKWEC